MSGRHALHLGRIVLFYASVVLWLTWPLGAQLGSALPDVADATRYDALYSIWALAHESHALVTAPAHVADAPIYFPTERALFYGPTAAGALPLFAPVYLATGNPTLAANVMFLGAVALTAASMHVVVVRWTSLPVAGLVAAWTFLTTRWVLWEWLPTTPHAAVLFYFPLIVFLAAAPIERGTFRRLAPLVVVQCLTEVTYVAPALLGPLVVLASWRVVRPQSRRAGLALLAVVGVTVLVLAPVLAGHLRVAHDNPAFRAQTIWKHGEPPTALPWGLIGIFSPLAVQPIVFLLIGVGALTHLVRRGAGTPGTAWRHATFWSIAGVVLSLTPVVVWGGRHIRTPLGILQGWLPMLQSLRVPTRLGIAGLVGLSSLAGLAFAECAGSLRRPFARGALAALVLTVSYAQFRHGLAWPFVRAAIPGGYPVHAAIGSDDPLLPALRNAAGPVLELPVDAPLQVTSPLPPGTPFLTDPRPLMHVTAMYRAIFHHRPLLNGYASYYPRAWPDRMRLARALPDAAALSALRAETGLETIVVHRSQCAPEERERWDAVREGRDDLRLEASVGDDLVFRVVSRSAEAVPSRTGDHEEQVVAVASEEPQIGPGMPRDRQPGVAVLQRRPGVEQDHL